MFAYAFSGRDSTGKSVEDMVYEAQRKVILEIAVYGTEVGDGSQLYAVFEQLTVGV